MEDGRWKRWGFTEGDGRWEMEETAESLYRVGNNGMME
jgi:hypothetical protein